MAKKPANTGGPYLATAVFCENLVEGADGAMSAIRIVDHLTITLPADAPPDVPSDEKRLPVSIWLLVGFKKGYSTGKHQVQFVMQSPSGKAVVAGQREITFRDEPHSGSNLKINLTIAIKSGGLFWVDVKLDGKRVTRAPLQITVNREEAATPAPASKARKSAAKAK